MGRHLGMPHEELSYRTERFMNVYTAWGLAAVGVCIAVGVACYATGSAWPLLGLIFIPSVSGGKGKCE